MESLMRLRHPLGPVAAVAILVGSIGLVACSSDDGADDAAEPTQQAQASPDLTRYCEAVRAGYDIAVQLQSADPPAESMDRLVDQFAIALTTAPDAVRRDYAQVLFGNESAQDKIDDFNNDTCGVDTGSVRR
jgi:hypothetical protein